MQKTQSELKLQVFQAVKDNGSVDQTRTRGVNHRQLEYDIIDTVFGLDAATKAALDLKASLTALNSKVSKTGDTLSGYLQFLSGNGIDTTSTAGIDVLNIGTDNAQVINIGGAGTIVNIPGQTNFENVINLAIEDKLIRLNVGGAAGSGFASGFEVEEGGAITSYFKTSSDRIGFDLLAPNVASKLELDLSLLTINRRLKSPDENGTIATKEWVLGTAIPAGGFTENIVGLEYNQTDGLTLTPGYVILTQAQYNAKLTGNAPITASTGTKISYDANGLVTGKSSLLASDIPTLPVSKITGLEIYALDNAVLHLNSPTPEIINTDARFNNLYTFAGLQSGALQWNYLDLQNPTDPSYAFVVDRDNTGYAFDFVVLGKQLGFQLKYSTDFAGTIQPTSQLDIEGYIKFIAPQISEATPSRMGTFDLSALTANRSLTIRDQSGTVALLSDLTGLGMGITALSQAFDYDNSTPATNGQTLVWNSTTNKFKPTSIAAGDVTTFNTRSGAVALLSSDVTNALGYTPYNSTNPANYITSAALTPYALISGQAFTGNISATNLSGTNTGDETNASILTKIGYTPYQLPAGGNSGQYINGLGALTAFPSIPTQYTDEQAQDAVGTILSNEFTYNDAANTIAINSIAYSKITGAPTPFTIADARNAISATGNISYNATTGVISTGLTQYTDTMVRTAMYQNFQNITYASTISWDNLSQDLKKAKTTATGSFTLNMPNVASGTRGVFKLITNTATAITVSFDASYTHKMLNTTMTTYTFPAGTGKEYFMEYLADGTTLEWVIVDSTGVAVNPLTLFNGGNAFGASVVVGATDNFSTFIRANNSRLVAQFIGSGGASTDNRFAFTSVAPGSTPIISLQGGDANIGLNFVSVGTGAYNWAIGANNRMNLSNALLTNSFAIADSATPAIVRSIGNNAANVYELYQSGAALWTVRNNATALGKMALGLGNGALGVGLRFAGSDTSKVYDIAHSSQTQDFLYINKLVTAAEQNTKVVFGATASYVGTVQAVVNIAASRALSGAQQKQAPLNIAQSATANTVNNGDVDFTNNNIIYRYGGLENSILGSRTAIAASSTLALNNDLLGVDTTAARTITLPAANTSNITPGRIYWIKDETGNAATNNISLARTGTDTIDGTTGKVAVNSAYGAIGVYSDGVSKWFTL